jgi:eukaryotic-like serine/threonine-protein kinase
MHIRMIGQSIAHYRILEVLGEGGMGVVYKAEDVKLNRLVAMKFLRSSQDNKDAQSQYLIREARAAAALDHPNVCTIYEIGTAPDGNLFITMPFYQGETLRHKMMKAPLSMQDAIDYTIGIAQGLATAHRHGLMHRDIKPENVIVTTEGVAKILDFGLAKFAGPATVSQPGSVVGTYAYMSPEHFRTNTDRRSDLWSLGVVLYEMLTGLLPFRGENIPRLMDAILHKTPTPANELRPELPIELCNVLDRSLAKAPEERYQRAEEMLAHLFSVRQGLGLASVQTTALRVPSRPVSVAVLPFTNLGRDEEASFFSDGLADELIHLLSQVRGLRVVSQASSSRFKAEVDNVRSIAERLNVDAVLEGTIRKVASTIRLSVHLSDAHTGFQLWSQRYDREVDDIFSLQEDIALSIVSMLRLNMGTNKEPLQQRYKGNAEAHTLYLQGRYFWSQLTEENIRKAGECFQQAIAADPSCAPAYAGLADFYVSMGFWGVIVPSVAWPRANDLALMASELDVHLAEAQVSLAKCALFNDWNWQEAETRLLLAIEYNPSLSAAHFWYAILLIQLGRFDSALLELRCARELDPFSLAIGTGVAWAHYYKGQYPRAIEECSKVFALSPNYFEANACMGLIEIRQKKFTDAIDRFEKALPASGNSPIGIGFLAYAYGLGGRHEDAQRMADQLVQLASTRYVTPCALAMFYLGREGYDQALAQLEDAFIVRDAFLAYAKVFPPYEPLRGDPRFKLLLDKTRTAVSGSWKMAPLESNPSSITHG